MDLRLAKLGAAEFDRHQWTFPTLKIYSVKTAAKE
jgi:hypothetical protein